MARENASAAPVGSSTPVHGAAGAEEGRAEAEGRGVGEARALGAPERVTDCVSVVEVEGEGAAEREAACEALRRALAEGEGAVEREAACEALRSALAEGEQVGGVARPVVVQPPQGQGVGAPLPVGQ